MGKPVIQPSFAAGELSPLLYGRVDLEKYHIGLATCRNFFVDYRGGIANRAGTQFIGQCRDITSDVRVIPFEFNTLQTYALEFGNLYMRVIMNGGYVLEPVVVIQGITQANPGVVTANAHGYVDGDWVSFALAGMTDLNINGPYIVSNATANTFTLTDVDGNVIDTTTFGAFVSGDVARLFTLTTPYAGADLALLRYTQSNDTMTLFHPNYTPRDLTRTEHWAWTLSTITFAASISAPTGGAGTAALTAGTTTYQYVVTAINQNGEESVASAVISIVNCKLFAEGTGPAPQVINLTWNAVAGATYYNIYKAPENAGGAPPAGSLFGFIGSATQSAFTDDRIISDFTNCPPTHQNPFANNNNPSVGCYYQQRKTFAASLSQPQTVWLTKSGAYTNMDTATPSKSDDALTYALASQQVNAIRGLVPMSTGLVALTASGAWLVNGGGGIPPNPITPTSIQALPQAYNGCGNLQPIVVGNDIIYVQSKGSIVRDLAFNYLISIYTGDDKSVLSNHLFFGHTLVDWCYAEEPFKIIWAVRDDGILLSFTYLKEQDVYGWSRHDTDGKFLSVCSITEGIEDAVYCVVQRNINGKTRKLVERMHSRNMLTKFGPNYGNVKSAPKSDVTQAWFVDCGAQYPLNFPNATCTPSATGKNAGDVITLMADADTFSETMVADGNVVRINGGVLTVSAYTSPTQVDATVSVPLVDTSPAEPNHWTCTKPIKTISGLKYAEGKTVKILAGGNVEPDQVVTDGKITISFPQDIITIGLGYTGQAQTLRLDVGGEAGTIQSKRKKISGMTARVVDTRGLKAGATFDKLAEYKERNRKVFAGQPIPLTTGDQRLVLDPLWQEEGQICIQQDYPLPMQIIAVIPELTMGDVPDV